MGLVFVPFFLLFGVIASVASKQTGGPASALPAAFGFVFALLMPIVYAAMGFVFGALSAFIYNLVAGWIGGIEMELQPISTAPMSPIQTNS
jgi:hypothetical protein